MTRRGIRTCFSCMHAAKHQKRKGQVSPRAHLPGRLHEGGVNRRGLSGGAGGGGEVGDDGEGLLESGVLAEHLLAVLPLLR